MLFICYERCSTCQRARRWLDEHGVSYETRPIKERCPTAEELLGWQALSDLPMTRFFNTSGQLYRQLGLKDKLPGMSDREMAALLATDGMLVKRPLLIGADHVLVGFREKEWAQWLCADGSM